MPTPEGLHCEREWLEGLRYEDKFRDEPLGTCVIHGDYWTDDCERCAVDQGLPSLPSREERNP